MKEKLVAVSGYFDPIHVGHVELFKKARSLGDKLIVILNNDKQAEIKKGKSFMPEEERKKILESFEMVDKVFISIDEDQTVRRSLKEIKPDIFANGGDRFTKEIPEAPICKDLGIEIIDGLGEKIQSSSWLIKKIKQ